MSDELARLIVGLLLMAGGIVAALFALIGLAA